VSEVEANGFDTLIYLEVALKYSLTPWMRLAFSQVPDDMLFPYS